MGHSSGSTWLWLWTGAAGRSRTGGMIKGQSPPLYGGLPCGPFVMVHCLRLPASCRNNPFRYPKTSSLPSQLSTLQRQKPSRRLPIYLLGTTSPWKKWQKRFGVLPRERQVAFPASCLSTSGVSVQPLRICACCNKLRAYVATLPGGVSHPPASLHWRGRG